MGTEPKKYSTGTKGRISKHSDKCKEFIRTITSFSLANEFIESVDPEHDERVWQRFQTPTDILPELQAWLGGEAVKPAVQAAPKPLLATAVKPASQIVRRDEKAALQRTRAWIASPAGRDELGALTPSEAAEAALQRLYRELTGAEP